MFDVLEVEEGESNDNIEANDVFQQEEIIDVVPINVEYNVQYYIGDVEVEVVHEGGTSRDANQNEEHVILALDMNNDRDYDILICIVHKCCLKFLHLS